ncbi:hypothetical protein [Crocosphaera sp. XPORK-15E]|uniref:hypothetical protein n=1 Tax=Crocosphaera sp. XPORK-15E TaxID=3110247 RepID=UPI002B216A52|nr:hypothetical protein [Crocosphaera sp. XPORK-15E]MEA5537080.1 hypothetical protein [Crocosphaera sp. XPORK-15E]
MPQTKAFKPTPSVQPCPTCADCPKFRDFRDARNRGWCSAFDKVTRLHHTRTSTCDTTIESQSKQQNRLTVMVELVTHELDIDPERGFTFPKHEQVIEVSMTEVSRKAVEQAILPHREFNDYYIAGFWEPQYEDF